MKKRINISELEPNAYQAMFGLEKYLSQIDLNPNLKALIKIRASQINDCAYCIQMHTTEALKLGESEQKLFALPAWKESPLFSDHEKIILKLTEEVTLIADNGLSTTTYKEALSQLGEEVLAQALMQIVTINAWNRMAIATHMIHE